MSESWTKRGACRGVDRDGRDRFHPNTTGDPDIAQATDTAARAYELARTYCRACPVTVECLRYALTVETPSSRNGIWGGTSPRQRRELTLDDDLQAAVAKALVPPSRPRLTTASTDRTTFTDAEQRAANAAYDRYMRGGPELSPDQAAAYRAYQRAAMHRRREARRAAADRPAEEAS